MYKSTLQDLICSLKIAPRLIQERKNGSTKPQGLYKIFPSTNGGESGKIARGTTLFFKNHQQNGSFRSHQILKKKIPITSFICFLSLIPSILFCFVSSIMGVDLYMSFQKYCFWLEKRGSTYTRIDLNMRKYGTLFCSTAID